MTVFLILIVLVIAGAVTFFLMKKGKIEDKNGNNIPDVVEEKIEDVKELVNVVKERATRVVEETKDVDPTFFGQYNIIKSLYKLISSKSIFI
jgi:uncharacterized protein (UPF0333 family)